MVVEGISVSAAEVASLLISLLTIFLLILSVNQWALVWQRWWKKEPVLTSRNRSLRVRVPRFAVAMVLAYLALYCYIVWANWGKQGELLHTQENLTLIRNALYATLFNDLLIIPLLLAALFFGARTRLDLVRLGFRYDRLGEQLKEGGWGFLLAVLPVALLLAVTYPIRSTETLHPYLRILKEFGTGQEVVLIFLTAGIAAPLMEELIFRVILQNWLAEYLPSGFAIGITAVIFSSVHGLPDAIPLFALSLVLGVIFHYRRSYVTIVTIHFLFNLYNLIAAMASPVPA